MAKRLSLNTNTRIGRRSWAAVATSNAFMAKQPSPTIAATVRDGRASWGPTAARVDIDVNQRAGRLQVRREPIGRQVAEARAERDHHVDPGLEVALRRAVAAHAEHAEGQRMVLGERALALGRGGHRAGEALGDDAQLVRGIAAAYAAARQQQRSLGIAEQP